MKKAWLVMIPSPGIGHLVSAVEFAKRLINRDSRFSITIIIIKRPFDTIPADCTQNQQIHLVYLPKLDLLPSSLSTKSVEFMLTTYIDGYKPLVKQAVTKLLDSESDSVQLVGFIMDMFCTSMMDVANDFGVPSYIYFASGAGFLGFLFHSTTTRFNEWKSESIIPSYANPVPVSVLPTFAFNEYGHSTFSNHAKRFREAKGIIINTFAELQPHAVDSLLDGRTPPVYTVGPILDINRSMIDSGRERDSIIAWLDGQPPSSVVFLCFGSGGSFGAEQVKQIAVGLERSGHRFLWALRKPQTEEGKLVLPTDYSSDSKELEEILPDGFLERIGGKGMVCGWAPQMEVLGHAATGGFLSHCGWNSILESLWNGVPIVTWPMYAEQQINAFELAINLKLAVVMKLDYRTDGGTIVTAEEVENGIRRVMEGDGEVGKRVKKMAEMSKAALMSEGGSSFTSLGRLISDMLGN